MGESNNKKKTDEITFQISLKTDKDFIRMLKTSKITQIPLKFFEDNIEKAYINDKEINPSMIQIGPPASMEFIDFKIGEKIYKNIPFNSKLNLNDEIIFESVPSSDLGMNIIFKIKLLDNDKINASLSLHEKSDNIKDLLDFELTKKELIGKSFEIYTFDMEKPLLNGVFDIFDVNEDLISIYKKLNYINEKLNLNLKHEKDYIISSDELQNIDYLCDYIKNKKIPIDNFSVTCEVPATTLNYMLTNKKNIECSGKNSIRLLNETIDLGTFHIKIKEPIYLNLDELNEIYETNKNNTNPIKIPLKITSDNPEELFLNFNN
ncbi:hypothetical protein SAMN05216439_0423 [Methanobrevibacter gottschalkii]|uniref:Uncharacterized protein n=1 Tax=Methanobrevibacter gottschalkii TaxID=190974 RepID=A0A1H7PP66_9EURY|nr:hypothetical protein [Methanobrevibacter gottschalkii]SEL37386.1 hypothetical protein SAMN05216439_0423 [Methanobrevibacter gottschalkii]